MTIFLAQSSAEKIGYMVGVIFGLSLFIGLAVFAVVSIVKAFKRKTVGWIVAGSISGAILLLFLVLFSIGFVRGFQMARQRRAAAFDSSASSEGVAGRIPGSKSAATEVVYGQDMDYSLRLPLTWKTKRDVQSFDTLSNRKSLYIGVIAEEANLGNPDTLAQIARERIKDSTTDVQWTEPEPLVIDGRNWLQFHVNCTVQKLSISYQFYVYAGKEGSFQIVGWTSQEFFDRDAYVMREIMQSFRFPAETKK